MGVHLQPQSSLQMTVGKWTWGITTWPTHCFIPDPWKPWKIINDYCIRFWTDLLHSHRDKNRVTTLISQLRQAHRKGACPRLIETQRWEPRLLSPELALSMHCLEPRAWPGLASGSWIQQSQESFILHLFLPPSLHLIHFRLSVRASLKWFQEKLVLTNYSYVLQHLPASLEVTSKLGCVTCSGQWAIKRSHVTSRPKYIWIGAWP